MGRKFILATLSLTLSLSLLCGCGKEVVEDPSVTPNAQEVAASQEIVSSYEAVYSSVGTARIGVVGAEAFTDINGEPAIRIYYDFTNASDTTTYAGHLNIKAEQNGVILDPAFAAYGEDVDEYGQEWLDIRPGITIRCIAEYACDPDAGTVTFSVGEDGTSDSVMAEFDMTALPGRPTDVVENTVLYPTWLTDVSSSAAVDSSGSTVEITGYDIVEYREDYIGVRIYVNYTNNTDAVSTFYATNYFRVMQDGIQMKMPLNVDATEDELMLYDEVAPGETVKVAITHIATSTSPVEIEFYDGWTGETLAGQIFDPFSIQIPTTLD